MINSKDFEQFSEIHSLYRDFWNWCKSNHPAVLDSFVNMTIENNKLAKCGLERKEVKSE